MSDLERVKAARGRFFSAAWEWLHTPVLYRGEQVERRAIAGYSQKYLDAADSLSPLTMLCCGLIRASNPEAMATRCITAACGMLGISADDVLTGPEPAEAHTAGECDACLLAMGWDR